MGCSGSSGGCSSEGVVPLRSIPDVIGLVGRREGGSGKSCAAGPGRSELSRSGPELHDVTIVDMGDMPESAVSIPELSALSQQWPPAVLSHMGWRQKELEEMRSAAKVKFRQSRPSYCGSLIKSDMYWHICTWPSCGGARCRGAPSGRACIRTVWITCVEPTMFRGRSSRPALRSFFRRGWFPGRCGRMLCLLSTPGSRRMCYCLVTFTCHYRIHKRGLLHIAFRKNYLSQLRALLPSPVTLPPARVVSPESSGSGSLRPVGSPEVVLGPARTTRRAHWRRRPVRVEELAVVNVPVLMS